LAAQRIIEATVETIRDRSRPEGGFSMFAGESFRPDVTAWAVMALEASGNGRDLTITACQQLARSQLSDGRIPVEVGHPESYWPTSLTLLAWKIVPGFKSEMQSALRFLLTAAGKHWPKKDDYVALHPGAHDTSITGWPWTENTHSWIEPTTLAVLALKVCGHADNKRVLEALRMILDRQLPSGGWNVGNTSVFGKQLRPVPECTGHALCALAGSTEYTRVKSSLNYLAREAKRIRTPLALAWIIFGLAAWSNRPANARHSILESLSLQEKYGSYDTTLLSQLLVAYFTQGDLFSLLF
jgi:hypothetical protein